MEANFVKYDNFTSTNIKTLWYSATRQQLIVEYHGNEEQYRYGSVSVDEWNELINSDSKGKFINESIKSKPLRKMMLND